MTSGEAWILILGWWEPYFRSARASPGWLTLFLAREISVFEFKSWWGLPVTPGRTGGCPWIWSGIEPWMSTRKLGTPGTPGTLTSLTRASKSKTHQRWYFLMWMIPRLTWPKQCQATKEGLNPDGSFKLSTLNMGRWSCFSRLSVLGKHAVYDEPLEVNEQV